MSAHTTGPWQAADVGDYGDFDGNSQVILGDDRRVAVVQVDPNSAEDRANARLIAAAPRLLQELQRLVNIADSGLFRDRAELSIATHPAYDDARELIKSVIGETK